MLVLTRRLGEKIVIGNDVVVTVLEVRNDQVRIGIDAPRSVQVHREEVHAQIAAANAAAVAAAAQTQSLLRHRPPRPPSLRAKDAPPPGPGSPSGPGKQSIPGTPPHA